MSCRVQLGKNRIRNSPPWACSPCPPPRCLLRASPTTSPLPTNCDSCLPLLVWCTDQEITPGRRQVVEGAPQFFGRVKRHTLAACHRFHDSGHAGGIAPVHPDYVDAQFVHALPPLACNQASGKEATDWLQMRNKARLPSTRLFAGAIRSVAGRVATGQETE